MSKRRDIDRNLVNSKICIFESDKYSREELSFVLNVLEKKTFAIYTSNISENGQMEVKSISADNLIQPDLVGIWILSFRDFKSAQSLIKILELQRGKLLPGILYIFPREKWKDFVEWLRGDFHSESGEYSMHALRNIYLLDKLEDLENLANK